MTCTTPDCGRPVHNKMRGLCSRCHQRWYKANGPVTGLTNAERATVRRAEIAARAKVIQQKADAQAALAVLEAERAVEIMNRPSAQALELLNRTKPWHDRMQAGETLEEIAQSEGLTHERVRQLLVKAGFPTKRSRVAAGHVTRLSPRMRVMMRILAQVDQFVQVGTKDECWPWTGGTVDPSNGKCKDLKYGRIAAFDPLDSPKAKKTYPHRVVYMLYRGAIPPGMTVDHLCWNTLCCNPDHLQLLTSAENSARKDPVKMKKNMENRRLLRLAKERAKVTA